MCQLLLKKKKNESVKPVTTSPGLPYTDFILFLYYVE